jgi:integrase
MNATSRRSAAKSEEQGPWLSTSFANLVRYQPSGTYFSRLRVAGKLIRRSLKTDVLSVAKLRLQDLEKAERAKAEKGGAAVRGRMRVGDALATFREHGFRPVKPRNRKDATPLKPAAIRYYEQRAAALLQSWPELAGLEIRRVTDQDCQAWAARVRQSMSASAFNHTLGLLRQVFEVGIVGGVLYHNPASGLMREREEPKRLELPSTENFNALVASVEKGGNGFSRPAADLIRFLAFTGLRLGEAAHVTWADVNFEKGQIVARGDPETGLKNRRPGEIRVVPLIPEARALLERLRSERGEVAPETRVMAVRECQKSIDNACKRLGIARITHHDLRHLFATRCIEAGVDVPTVSRWLGHKDGGALAMRVYGHLRDQHSAAMAQRVSFAVEEKGEPDKA